MKSFDGIEQKLMKAAAEIPSLVMWNNTNVNDVSTYKNPVSLCPFNVDLESVH